MTNLQRSYNKYNLLIIISTIVKNYNKIFSSALSLRHNCGIKLLIFSMIPGKKHQYPLLFRIAQSNVFSNDERGNRKRIFF